MRESARPKDVGMEPIETGRNPQARSLAGGRPNTTYYSMRVSNLVDKHDRTLRVCSIDPPEESGTK